MKSVAQYKQAFLDLMKEMEDEHGHCKEVFLGHVDIRTEGNGIIDRKTFCSIDF